MNVVRRYHRLMAMNLAETRRDLGPAVALFHSLSDATRLAIVQRLARGEARVVDLTGELGLAQSTVSAHLACLRDCRLVTGRPDGRQVFYSLAQPELLDLLRAAEGVLTDLTAGIAPPARPRVSAGPAPR